MRECIIIVLINWAFQNTCTMRAGDLKLIIDLEWPYVFATLARDLLSPFQYMKLWDILASYSLEIQR